MTKIINITTPAGFGDAFTYSSVIKNKYAKEYDQVYINVPRVAKLLQVLYNDTPNVFLGWVPGHPHIELRWQDCIADWESWRQVDWNRQQEREQACYDYFTNKYGKDYIVVHWRGRNNAGQKMVEMNHDYFENKGLPYINIDADWLTKNNDPIHFITDYRLLIEKSKEIHMYEGNWSSMVAGLSGIEHIPFYLHLYCKNELFMEHKVHHDVIRFIDQGKWMKDNVDVRYLFQFNKG